MLREDFANPELEEGIDDQELTHGQESERAIQYLLLQMMEAKRNGDTKLLHESAELMDQQLRWWRYLTAAEELDAAVAQGADTEKQMAAFYAYSEAYNDLDEDQKEIVIENSAEYLSQDEISDDPPEPDSAHYVQNHNSGQQLPA